MAVIAIFAIRLVEDTCIHENVTCRTGKNILIILIRIISQERHVVFLNDDSVTSKMKMPTAAAGGGGAAAVHTLTRHEDKGRNVTPRSRYDLLGW